MSEQLANSRQDKISTFTTRYEFEELYHQKKKDLNTVEEEKKYMANRGANNLAYQTSTIKYVKNHLNEEISAYLLLEVSNKDTVANLYQILSENARESYHGKILSKLVKGWYATKIGQKLPPLQTTTIGGKPFKIGESNGKFMLLDFWGSWCTPCIAEIPALKAFYQKNEKHLQLIGLLCKDTKQKALNAINKNTLKWVQLYSDTDEFGSLFGITAYPTKILIDPSGLVVKTFIGTNETMLAEIESLINK